MSIRYSRFTNIAGHRVEFARELVKPEERHFHREPKLQKAQIESILHNNKENTSKHDSVFK